MLHVRSSHFVSFQPIASDGSVPTCFRVRSRHRHSGGRAGAAEGLRAAGVADGAPELPGWPYYIRSHGKQT